MVLPRIRLNLVIRPEYSIAVTFVPAMMSGGLGVVSEAAAAGMGLGVGRRSVGYFDAVMETPVGRL